MEVAIKLLMAGGVFNIGYAFLIPLVMFALRRQTFSFARYGRSVALFNGAVLLSMIFLVQFSYFNLAMETFGAALLVAQSGLLALAELMVWLRPPGEEVARRSASFYLSILALLLGFAGAMIFVIGVVRGLFEFPI